jgi:glyoxylase-like metal-dependent hydrolase (beta-lactamase superfamily II)
MTWIRQNIPGNAVILNVSAHASNFQYSIVPAFAERNVFLGDTVYSRIFQVPEQEIRARRGVLSKMYVADTDSLKEMMRFRNLNYLFLPSHDALNSPTVLEKLKEPQFKLLHQEGDARIYLRTGR